MTWATVVSWVVLGQKWRGVLTGTGQHTEREGLDWGVPGRTRSLTAGNEHWSWALALFRFLARIRGIWELGSWVVSLGRLYNYYGDDDDGAQKKLISFFSPAHSLFQLSFILSISIGLRFFFVFCSSCCVCPCCFGNVLFYPQVCCNKNCKGKISAKPNIDCQLVCV